MYVNIVLQCRQYKKNFAILLKRCVFLWSEMIIDTLNEIGTNCCQCVFDIVIYEKAIK